MFLPFSMSWYPSLICSSLYAVVTVVVEVELAGLIHRQQLRNVVVRGCRRREDGALDLQQGQHREVQRHLGVDQGCRWPSARRCRPGRDGQDSVDVGAIELGRRR